MKFSHNKPNSEPIKGKVIKMEHRIPFLETNCLYLMPSMPEKLAVTVKEIVTNLMYATERTDYLFECYTCIHLLQDLAYSDTDILKTTIAKEGYNVLLPLNSYNCNPCQYLIARIEESNVLSQISQIIYSSECFTRKYACKLILEKMRVKPKETKDFLKHLVFKGFEEFICASSLLYRLNPDSVPPFPDIKKVLGIKEERVDFQQMMDMLDRMVENVKKLNKSNDVRAVEELRLMLRSVPTEYLIEMLKKFSKSQLIKASECLDPQTYAKNSHLRFEICKPSEMPEYELPKNKKIKNIGIYMLFICNEQTFEPVYFSNKSSFIVYLIYLIDRFKKKDSIEPIDMLDKERENEYYKLYNIIYPNHTDEAKSSYFSLTSEFKKDSKERRKKRLGDCYADIKVCVGSVCHNMGEIINPHIIENAGDHLATMPNKIHIPYELLL